MSKKFFFRIELTAEAPTAEEAWQIACEAFCDEPGPRPPMEDDLADGLPILGTEYTIDAGEV